MAIDEWPCGSLRRTNDALERLATWGQIVPGEAGGLRERAGQHVALPFRPAPGVTPVDLERMLGARRGGLEVLSLGRRLDLVKQVGSPAQLEATYGVSTWSGPLAIGHTRMSTESRIDLSHSQPFWVHGVPDLATVHNGHVTNYHQLRRRYEQQGATFYTDNDSEVIGVYLRDRMDQGEASPRRWPTRSPTSTVPLTTWSPRPRARHRPRPLRLQAAGAGRDRRIRRRGHRGDRLAPGTPGRLRRG